MVILYLPLDERPCNYEYPKMIARLANDVRMVVPPKSLLSCKKVPADVDALWYWIEKNVDGCDAAILSIEMLVYGGLLPSRLHHLDQSVCMERIGRIKQLKQNNPKLLLYASALIMRTPSYNSSEEEPEYYADYGEMIFQYGWLSDKRDREFLTKEEEQKLQELADSIPGQIIEDYEARRKINLEVNKQVMNLVKEGVIEFLSIPQDDSAPYGYTAVDQKIIAEEIIRSRLQQKVHTYPGADEVGCTLLSRVYTAYRQKTPQIYVTYSSTLGSQIIPKYEDRPFGESVKAHILAAGAIIASAAEDADLILLVNSPGKLMQEAWEQHTKDITYSSWRNLREFVQRITGYMEHNKKCILADIAFSNGADTELIAMLDEEQLLEKLEAYAGWNTACNSLGTVLAAGIIGLESDKEKERCENLIYRLLEDWGYQSHVRQTITQQVLPTFNATSYHFNGQEEEITESIRRQLCTLWQEQIRKSFDQWNICLHKVYTPWHRMFEIGMELEVKRV